MTRILTIDDFIDTYAKLRQRGFSFISSKFTPNASKRTQSAFNELDIESANWWIIPKVKERWNKLITGDKNLGYEKFVVQNFIKNQDNTKMISLGSGACSNELEFASNNQFNKITCIDISDVLLNNASQKAKQLGLNNIEFLSENVYKMEFPDNEYDIVLFNASLHHLKDVDYFLKEKIKRTLKSNGKLIINEYVGPNRLQFPNHQIKSVNESLAIIPKKFRKRFKLNFYKNKFYGSGIIRMFIADPSECVESNNILPVIHNNFKTLYEAPYGGNILMNCLKDIAHHFVELNDEKIEILKRLFEFEDEHLKENKSDFVFGVYENTNSK